MNRSTGTQRLPMFSVTHQSGSPSVDARRFNVAGIFAGIGGIELGLESAGHRTSLLCEIDPGARAVLDAHFAGVDKQQDVTTLKEIPRDIEVLAAGFPCQDLSQAGLTAGIGGKRSGLIEHVLALLRSRRQRRRPVPWVLLENVPFMLQLNGGRALAVIVDALDRMGYRWAYRVVDSLAFGVPQRRERVFLLASMEDDPRRVLYADQEEPVRLSPSPTLAFGFYWTEGVRGLGAAVDAVPTLKGGSTVGIPSPPAILLPRGAGLVTPSIEDAERLQGFDPGWTLPAEAVGRSSHRWKLVGNAVTVHVAAWLGRRLANPGAYDGSWDRKLAEGARWPSAAWSVGKGRFEGSVSTWPIRIERPRLEEFVQDPRPLSVKATAGFWSRFRDSPLRRPSWFDAGIVAHLERLQSGNGEPGRQAASLG
jgi:DNA (cytosine-5)-methyltransferase 1